MKDLLYIDYGINSYSSYNYSILNNNFRNNISNAFCENSEINYWYNGIPGNYWEDYQDRYLNAESNGSTWSIPYEIEGTNNMSDNYPLMNPFQIHEDSLSRYPLSLFSTLILIKFIIIIIIQYKKSKIETQA